MFTVYFDMDSINDKAKNMNLSGRQLSNLWSDGRRCNVYHFLKKRHGKCCSINLAAMILHWYGHNDCIEWADTESSLALRDEMQARNWLLDNQE